MAKMISKGVCLALGWCLIWGSIPARAEEAVEEEMMVEQAEAELPAVEQLEEEAAVEEETPAQQDTQSQEAAAAQEPVRLRLRRMSSQRKRPGRRRTRRLKKPPGIQTARILPTKSRARTGKGRIPNRDQTKTARPTTAIKRPMEIRTLTATTRQKKRIRPGSRRKW